MDPVQPPTSPQPLMPDPNVVNTQSTLITPAPETPAIITTQESDSQPPKKASKKLLFLLFLLIAGFGFLGICGVMYAVAYEKITIPNPQIQKAITHFVQTLPFTPKTPQFIVEKSLQAHTTVTSHVFDISVAGKSEDILSQLGISALDITVQGYVNYTDKNNILLTADVKIPNLLQAKIHKPDANVYFKFDQLPNVLFEFIGLNPEVAEKATKSWVKFDSSSNSAARKFLQETSDSKSYTQKLTEDTLKIFDREEFKKHVNLSTATLSDKPVYKLAFKASGNELDQIGTSMNYKQKLSSIIDEVSVETYVDQKSYLTQKVILHTKIKAQDTGDFLSFNSSGTTSFAAIMSFSDYSSQRTIDTPSETISVDEFVQIFLESPATGGSWLMPSSNQFAQARDSQRRADLLGITNAIYQYAAEHNGNLPGTNFPTTPMCIGTAVECFNLSTAGAQTPIVPTYISVIPKDPSTGSDTNTGYTIHINTNGRLEAKAVGELVPEIVVTR